MSGKIPKYKIFQYWMVMKLRVTLKQIVTWIPLLETWKIYMMQRILKGIRVTMSPSMTKQGIKMRRRPLQAQAEEEIEDEAAEAAELCRLLMEGMYICFLTVS